MIYTLFNCLNFFSLFSFLFPLFRLTLLPGYKRRIMDNNNIPSVVDNLCNIFEPLFNPTEAPVSTQDPIFISIDLGHDDSNKGPSDIGISFLYSRCFTSLLYTTTEHTHPILSSHHYWISSRKRKRQKRRAKKRFLFGDICKFSFSNQFELREALVSLCCYNKHTSPPDSCCASQTFTRVPIPITDDINKDVYRPIIIIGHDLSNELSCLKRVGFSPVDVAPVMAYLDTQKIAYALYGRIFRLGDLCRHLGFRSRRLHTSGNDAVYTLLALLRMAAIIFSSNSSDSDNISSSGRIDKIQLIISTVLENTQRRAKGLQRSAPSDWQDNLDGIDIFDLKSAEEVGTLTKPPSI